jgi:hypothetical protein
MGLVSTGGRLPPAVLEGQVVSGTDRASWSRGCCRSRRGRHTRSDRSTRSRRLRSTVSCGSRSGYTWELNALYHVPSAYRRVPTTIELTALYVDRHRHFLSYLQGELVHIIPEELKAHLTWVLRTKGFEDIFLYLPRVSSLAGTSAQGEDLDDFAD